MKPTDYNDYADAWIELKAQVNMMHSYSLQKNWQMSQECAVKAKELCEKLLKFYGEVQ